MLTRDEITALARSNAKTMREYLATQLAPIHQRQSTAADAGRVSELQQHIVKLEARLLNIEKSEAAHRRHLQELEKKYGRLAGKERD